MKYTFSIVCYVMILSGLLISSAPAQSKLDRDISIHVKQTKLSALLDTIGKRNSFYFSYSNDQINADSLVNLSIDHQPLSVVLDSLFKGNVEYKESPGYVVLRLAPNELTLKAENVGGKEQSYYISGYILDEHSGLGIPNASIYEKRLLISTLSDQKGYFKIRVKAAGMITLTVSKEFYKDASVNFLTDVTIGLKPREPDYNQQSNPDKAAKSWLGRIFISSKLRTQGINLRNYFASAPFQTSLTPGLSSRGMMSSQVVNHFSFNLIGGYTAGLDGVEFAYIFNINRLDVKYLQVAGLFNVTGGNFNGLQIAGIGNNVLKKVNGIQLATTYNMVTDSVKGLQIGGIFNSTKGSVNGVQLSSILNFAKKNSSGFRIAGIANITGDTAKGAQLAMLFNKAKVMNGFSFGLVNITDTLNGYALGLLNISVNGYHRIMAYSSDIAPVNLAFKTGNQKLYAVLSAGVNPADRLTYFTLGYGLGHDFILNNRYSISAEISSQTLLANKWSQTHSVNRLSALVNFKMNPKISFFAGPSFNMYFDKGPLNEQEQFIRNKPGLMDIGRNKAWIGWTAGVSFL
ncbi:MAG: carboxypeptidase-like regulatory domain-containing protein [Pedobacter sp.]|uniref:carboxypeptidase-like regulatory domain-containing protein n=1 Tax=Pedobacter sp. TaxID=1411316 RepID=UPI0033992B3E